MGRGGDPRLTRGLDNLIEVPGLDGWGLGKYSVTVEEYRAFVEDGGYDEVRWWDAIGWQQRENEGWEAPKGWDEQLWTPNRPVVNIAWFEASAYCAWLSAQWGRQVSLPTEAQWQRVAQGEDRRRYPWGDRRPDSEWANFDDKVGRPSPVGVYPAGNGPFGHCDLAGNVWEWCSYSVSEHALPEFVGGEIGGTRVLRGGGWVSPADELQVAYRTGDSARYRYVAFGFRVAVAPASLGP